MAVDEKTRLDLRAKFEELMGKRLADATMQAMPPLDYDQFATKTDVANLGVELRGDIAELRGEMRGDIAELRGDMAKMEAGLHGEMAELRGDLRGEMGSNVKTIVLANLGTSLAVGGFVIGLG